MRAAIQDKTIKIFSALQKKKKDPDGELLRLQKSNGERSTYMPHWQIEEVAYQKKSVYVHKLLEWKKSKCCVPICTYVSDFSVSLFVCAPGWCSKTSIWSPAALKRVSSGTEHAVWTRDESEAVTQLSFSSKQDRVIARDRVGERGRAMCVRGLHLHQEKSLPLHQREYFQQAWT